MRRMFDCFGFYNAIGDTILAGNAYDSWDSNNGGAFDNSLTPFGVGQSLHLPNNTSNCLVKGSLANASTVLTGQYVYFNNVLGSASAGASVEVRDGTAVQCCIHYSQDGSITLRAGFGSGATILATYTGAFLGQQWNHFQHKIIISNTVGEWHVRKNGNTSDDFAATGLNTRNGTGTSQVNSIALGSGDSTDNWRIIDFGYWDTAGGDQFSDFVNQYRIRPVMAFTDNSVQFSQQNGGSTTFGNSSAATSQTYGANQITFIAVRPTCGGTLGNLTLSMNSGFTGHLNAALYDSDGLSAGQAENQPGTLLATCTQITNPVTGANTLTWVSAPTVKNGHKYYLAVWADASYSPNTQSGAGSNWAYALTYAGTFPSTVAGLGSTNSFRSHTLSATITVLNAGLVNDQAEDGTTTYVFDSTVGHEDLYGLEPFPTGTILGVDVIGMVAKSDAGTRGIKLEVKSGGTTQQYTEIFPNTTFNYYKYAQDTDPNTSAQWTYANLVAALIGQKITT